MVRKYIYNQEEFLESIDFEKCRKIYLDKYPFEDDFSFSDIPDLTIIVYELDNEVIGFGYYHYIDFIMETIFIDEYKCSEHHKSLLSEIITLIGKEKKIFIYQALLDDYIFYISNGFKLVKDYGQIFKIGYDMARYVLTIR